MPAISEDKIKKELLKGTPDQQIETYHSIGKWLHDEIDKKKKEAEELQEKLKAGKE